MAPGDCPGSDSISPFARSPRVESPRHAKGRNSTGSARQFARSDTDRAARNVGGMCCGPADAVKKPGKLALAGLFVPAF